MFILFLLNPLVYDYFILKHNVKGCNIDFENGLVLRNGRNVSIQLNEGFLCSYTLKNLLNFRFKGDQAGYKLASAFVEAGICVPQELFIKIFEKLAHV